MRKKGFTLIEIIIVISIVSILSTIIFLRFNIIDRIKEKTEIETFLNDINFAKEKSMVTGYDYHVIINDSNYKIGTFEFTKSGIIDRDLNYIKLKSKQKREFKFTSTGSIAGSDTIEFEGISSINKNKIYKLVISAAGGHARIE